MKISKELLDYIADGDLHLKLGEVEHSTDLREVVTVGYMLENEKSAAAPTAHAL